MRFETTLHRPVDASGVGLHSGVPVNIRVTPAPPSTGIVFVRTDLDRFAIPASWRHVARVSYATSLMRQGVLISTTEHLLSTFYSLGIDNAYIEIDNLEVPILDGSGLPFVELIRQAGIRHHRRQKRYLRVKRPVSWYADQIAPARTFGFDRDLDAMRNMGLIRGASLENAVCFTSDGVLNPGGLRFPDECCRHKALDLIGDLALIGRPLLGHVIAERAGHAMHAALVSRIMGDPDLYEVLTFDQLASRVAEALMA